MRSSIKVDNSGNVYVGGCLLDTTYYDQNLNTLVVKQWACIAKYNSTGSQQWLKKFGNEKSDIITAIDLDANNEVYAIGNYQGTFSVGAVALPVAGMRAAFVAKFNSANGNTVFAYQHGSSADEVTGYGIGINQQNGNVYTAGNYKSNISFNANSLTCQGVWDMYLVLLNNAVASDLQQNESEVAISIYPNPAKDFIRFSSTAFDFSNAYAKIYGMDGRLIQHLLLDDQHRVEISSLSEGNYVIEIGNDKESAKRIITKN